MVDLKKEAEILLRKHYLKPYSDLDVLVNAIERGLELSLQLSEEIRCCPGGTSALRKRVNALLTAEK